jgi:site-specific recombinase XerD
VANLYKKLQKLPYSKGRFQRTLLRRISVTLANFGNISKSHEDAPSVTEVSDKHIFSFFQYIDELGLEATSQARMLSGLKAFINILK